MHNAKAAFLSPRYYFLQVVNTVGLEHLQKLKCKLLAVVGFFFDVEVQNVEKERYSQTGRSLLDRKQRWMKSEVHIGSTLFN